MSLTLEEKLGLAKWLEGALEELRADLDAEAAGRWPEGARHEIMIGGQMAGWASMPKARKSARVTSAMELLAFVEAHYPTEVETETEVHAARIPEMLLDVLRRDCPLAVTDRKVIRPGFLTKLAGALKAKGKWADPATGEVLDVPGITVETGKLSPRVNLDDGATEIIGEAWRAGRIDVAGLLALPASAEAES